MKKILFVNACVRPCSRTCLLAQEVLKKLNGQIEEVHLGHEQLSPLDLELLEKRTSLFHPKIFQILYFAMQPSLLPQMKLLLQRPTGIWLFLPS